MGTEFFGGQRAFLSRALRQSGLGGSRRAVSRCRRLVLEHLEDRRLLAIDVHLVADVNPNLYPVGSNPANLAEVNGVTYFTASTATSGRELWKSDGTAAGTVLVRDIRVGSDGSYPSFLANVGGELFFSAYDESNGNELWKSDGTEAGTVLVKDIAAGSGSSSPGLFTNVNGTLFFVAGNSTSGSELWKSDGTESGTVLVKDIVAGSGGSSPSNLTNVNGTLFFTANDGTAGTEIWKSDGTEAGTVLVKDINPTSESYYDYGPGSLTNVNGTLFFSANDGAAGYALWKSDGTEAGTILVKDTNPANGPYSGPGLLTNVTGTLFFVADDGTNGRELWKSDGTEAGTVLVKSINPDNGAYYGPGNLTNVNGTLFFRANDGSTGWELWKSDGTDAGTVLVKDIDPAASRNSYPVDLTNVNGTLFFVANDGTNGSELWKSDGTDAGTIRVKDIRPGAEHSNADSLTNLNGTLFFRADDGTNGWELWKSDGTDAGTVLVKDIAPAANGDSSSRDLTDVDGTVFFVANDGFSGRELWKSDGTEAGTTLVKDIRAGSGAHYDYGPGNLTNVNGTLFFTANDGTTGYELWKSEGMEAGTVLVKDIGPGSGSYYSSGPRNLTNVNGTLFFSTDDGTNGREIWKSDGTAGGTVLVKDIRAGSGRSYPGNLTNVNGTLFFIANDGTNGFELWKSDGTEAGTVLVKDIDPTGSSARESLTNVNGTLFFIANDGTSGPELWKSDGTEAGTVLVKDIRPGSGFDYDYGPRNLTNVNGTLFFLANDGTTGYEIWKSDGTETGTVLVKDINPASKPYEFGPRGLANVNGTLFFIADDGTNGRELWKSDGTEAGTVLVKDIRPGSESYYYLGPKNLTNVNGTLFFTADDETNGRELWKSDGTPAGTVMVEDIRVSGSSHPGQLTNVGGALFFTANDLTHGDELWRLVETSNHAPVLDPIGDKGINEEQPLSFTVTASDPNDVPPNALTLSATGLPAGASFDPATGLFTWTPTESQQGPYEVTFLVSDDGTPNLSGSETITITVNEVNDAPVLDPIGDKAINEEQQLSFTVTASDPNDVPPNALTRSATGLPAGASFDPATGLFTWTPTESQQGTFAVTFLVADDGATNLSDSETITITVNEVNDAPVLDPIGNQSVDQDRSLTFTVMGSDPNDTPPNGLTLSAGGLPQGATFDPATRAFAWTPTGSQLGDHQMTFQVTDNGAPNLSDAETITITVNPVVTLPGGKGVNSVTVLRKGDNVQVLDSKKKVLFNQPLSLFQKLTILGTANKSDRITVDFVKGEPFVLPGGIVFDGGAGADSLTLRGNASQNALASGANSVTIDGLGVQVLNVEQVFLDGGAGNDTYQVSDLNTKTTISDNRGIDLVDFSLGAAGVKVDLGKSRSQAQKVFASNNNTLALKGIFENAVGTPHADWIRGNALANQLRGGEGNDTLYGNSGNDTLYGGPGDDWLYGDAGNDALYGEAGNNVLLGGAGKDVLDTDSGVVAGSEGRNLLIGGAGADTLKGGLGEEILIGGTTKCDNKAAALAVIMGEWTSGRTFAERWQNIENGLDGGNLGLIQLVRKTKTTPKGTVRDDGVRDMLFGGDGSDWFLNFNKDDAQNLGPGDH